MFDISEASLDRPVFKRPNEFRKSSGSYFPEVGVTDLVVVRFMFDLADY